MIKYIQFNKRHRLKSQPISLADFGCFYMQTVTLTRVYEYPKETVGHLTVGDFSCRTLELPWKDNQRNISCIPKGTYTVKYTLSGGSLGWTYEVQDVPGRSGIRMHPGNYYTNTTGCILFGDSYGDLNKDGIPDILHSVKTKQAFEDYMQRKDFTLIIT